LAKKLDAYSNSSDRQERAILLRYVNTVDNGGGGVKGDDARYDNDRKVGERERERRMWQLQII
jgi:hypothetical protein